MADLTQSVRIQMANPLHRRATSGRTRSKTGVEGRRRARSVATTAGVRSTARKRNSGPRSADGASSGAGAAMSGVTVQVDETVPCCGWCPCCRPDKMGKLGFCGRMCSRVVAATSAATEYVASGAMVEHAANEEDEQAASARPTDAGANKPARRRRRSSMFQSETVVESLEVAAAWKAMVHPENGMVYVRAPRVCCMCA